MHVKKCTMSEGEGDYAAADEEEASAPHIPPRTPRMNNQSGMKKAYVKAAAAEGVGAVVKSKNTEKPELKAQVKVESSNRRFCKKINMCKFMKEGGCTRGGNCGYAHTADQIGETVLNPQNLKMELCTNHPCRFTSEQCWYAHGMQEIGQEKSSVKPVKGGKGKKGKGKGGGKGMMKPGEVRKVQLKTTFRSSSKSRSKSQCRRSPAQKSILLKLGVRRSTAQRPAQNNIPVKLEVGRSPDRRHARRDDTCSQVLPIIIQTCSLFPLHSNLSAK